MVEVALFQEAYGVLERLGFLDGHDLGRHQLTDATVAARTGTEDADGELREGFSRVPHQSVFRLATRFT